MDIRIVQDYQTYKSGTVARNVWDVTAKMMIRKGVAQAVDDNVVLAPIVPDPMGDKADPKEVPTTETTTEPTPQKRGRPRRKVKVDK